MRDDDGQIERFERAVHRALVAQYGNQDLEVWFDRESRELRSNQDIDFAEHKGLVVQALKEALIGPSLEAERDGIYAEFVRRIGDVVDVTVKRIEGRTTIVDLGDGMDGILLHGTGVLDATHRVGDRVRCAIRDVETVGSRVKVVLVSV